MNKENSFVAPVRVVIAIVLFFVIIAFVNILNFRLFIFNPKFIVETANTDVIVKEIKNELKDKWNRDQFDEDVDGFVDELIEEDFIDYYLECFISAAMYGESIYDSDDMYDLIDELTEDYFEEHDEISEETREELLQGFVSNADEVMNNLEETTKDSDINFSKITKKVIDALNITLISLFVLIVVDILIHKNKGIAVKSIGKSGIVASVCNTLGIGGIWGFVMFIIRHSNPIEFDNPAGRIVINMINKIGMDSMLVAVLVFALSIILSVWGGNMAKNYEYEDEDDLDRL